MTREQLTLERKTRKIARMWEHEMKRIREMSVEQLKARLARMTNTEKIRIFVEALKEVGHTALAREASRKLRFLTNMA